MAIVVVASDKKITMKICMYNVIMSIEIEDSDKMYLPQNIVIYIYSFF